MKNEIFSLWYKQPTMLTSLPKMSLMIKKEGFEGYGLYMVFADSLHLTGGYRECNFDDISLVLDCNRKLIKSKLKKILFDYDLFDFYVDDDGVEMIGGRKRAKNQAEKQINEFKSKEKISEEIKEVKPEITHLQDEELMYQAMYNNGN
jgi:hypothetical protein